MLTISQLAAYAGVTVRAVRHYHAKGLLPEPERDHSGYRRYDAAAVVELIRIRTLAEAGVPLSRIQELLGADEAAFAHAITEIDQRLRAEIRERQQHRQRIARLAAGDSLALPQVVTDYMDRLRVTTDAPERLMEIERDAWILIAARWPERIPEFIADKHAQLDDPLIRRLYRVAGQIVTGDDTEEHLESAADLLVEIAEQAAASGDLERQDETMGDMGFIDLLDNLVLDANPLTSRLQELMAERGWSGWNRLERVDRSG